ncbi:MAG: histidine kinase dimerization/phospho-acceptor domain-containing protein [Gemmatimonadales bacterium]
MSASRFRLRLAGWYAVAFLVGLSVLSLVMFQYLARASNARVARELHGNVTELSRAIRREWDETPGSWAGATRAALAEWPAGRFSYVVTDRQGGVLGTSGEPPVLARLTPAVIRTTSAGEPRDLPYDEEGGLRILLGRIPARDGPTVVAALPLASLVEERESLALWMLVSAAPALVLSLVGGYLLSRLALRPVEQLGREIAGLPPSLEGRLTVQAPPDELDRLAGQFNALLDRLEEQRAKNRQFLQQAAHQLRTPLTLVLGESELELQPGAGPGYGAAMQRIRTAAEQMRRRVNDLFLLAEMEAGARPRLRDRVDLDGLVLEALDLFRSRAHALRRTLELGAMDRIDVPGDPDLLREAITEMLENACRHGDPGQPVRVAVVGTPAGATVTVSNGVRPADADAGTARETAGPMSRGLGLPILRWIADAHGGQFEFSHDATRASASLSVPCATNPSAV